MNWTSNQWKPEQITIYHDKIRDIDDVFRDQNSGKLLRILNDIMESFPQKSVSTFQEDTKPDQEKHNYKLQIFMQINYILLNVANKMKDSVSDVFNLVFSNLETKNISMQNQNVQECLNHILLRFIIFTPFVKYYNFHKFSQYQYIKQSQIIYNTPEQELNDQIIYQTIMNPHGNYYELIINSNNIQCIRYLYMNTFKMIFQPNWYFRNQNFQRLDSIDRIIYTALRKFVKYFVYNNYCSDLDQLLDIYKLFIGDNFRFKIMNRACYKIFEKHEFTNTCKFTDKYTQQIRYIAQSTIQDDLRLQIAKVDTQSSHQQHEIAELHLKFGKYENFVNSQEWEFESIRAELTKTREDLQSQIAELRSIISDQSEIIREQSQKLEKMNEKMVEISNSQSVQRVSSIRSVSAMRTARVSSDEITTDIRKMCESIGINSSEIDRETFSIIQQLLQKKQAIEAAKPVSVPETTQKSRKR